MNNKKLPPLPKPPKPRKKVLVRGARDFAKELAVQRALFKQMVAEEKLREMQLKTRKKYMELHPSGRASVARKLHSLGLGRELKKGLKAIKKRRAKVRARRGKRQRGWIGREIRKYVG